jgi:alkanesulfonate monooxygenase SsuD/methylene tetrahydromethanopterin reductase-like flavin-dependent oxidoreductase (luciferase family)
METRREAVLRVATRAEQLGYTDFSIAEGWGLDAGVLLAEVAGKTSRIRLGTGILNVWGRSPATIAMLAAGLAEVSGGRFELGLGAGSPQLAEGLHGLPFRAPVDRLAEVTRQVRRLLDGERLAPGVPGGSRPLRLAVRPADRVRINLAALGPRAVRLSGELADGWLPFLLPLSCLGDGIRLLEEGAARSGEGRPLPKVRPALPVAVAEDEGTALELARWWLSFYLTSMGPLYAGSLRASGFGAEVDEFLAAAPGEPLGTAAQRLVDELVVWGRPEAARRSLDRWYGAGAELPGIVLPPGRGLDELEYALEVFGPLR